MNGAVILSAGSGTRMGGGIKKEYLLHRGKPLLYHVFKKFWDSRLFSVLVIVCREDYVKKTREMFHDFKGIHIISGGETRQESVYKSLCYLNAFTPDRVLIHDGARPFVSEGTIRRVLEGVIRHGACIPVGPATDTMKMIDTEGFVTQHLNRPLTRSAQTPQGFELAPLLRAHERLRLGHETCTDDSEIWGRFVGPVFTVDGDRENGKITYPEDVKRLMPKGSDL